MLRSSLASSLSFPLRGGLAPRSVSASASLPAAAATANELYYTTGRAFLSSSSSSPSPFCISSSILSRIRSPGVSCCPTPFDFAGLRLQRQPQSHTTWPRPWPLSPFSISLSTISRRPFSHSAPRSPRYHVYRRFQPPGAGGGWGGPEWDERYRRWLLIAVGVFGGFYVYNLETVEV